MGLQYSMLRNDQGNRTTPSYVAWTEQDLSPQPCQTIVCVNLLGPTMVYSPPEVDRIRLGAFAIGSPYTPYSIYLRGAIGFRVQGGIHHVAIKHQVPNSSNSKRDTLFVLVQYHWKTKAREAL